MPTKPPTPSSVVLIDLKHGLGTDVSILSHLYWSYSGGSPTAAQLNTLAASVGTAWNTNLAPLLSNQGLLEGVIITDLASATGATGVSSTTHAGTRAGSAPTVGVCVNVNLQIARKYRGGKPKVFFPFGITTDQGTESGWSSAFVSTVTTDYAAFQAAVNGLTSGPITLGTQQNVSYFSGSTTNPNSSKWARRNIPQLRGTPVVDAVTAFNVRQKYGSQRRRIAAS